jgi:aryl-alcohol dehydrogenase-like predicted oxidoreductase
LRLLKVESLHTLFLHSIREPIYGADIHNELLKLKSEGKISQVGYSGDGDNLKAITSKFRFDAFQATLNVLDLGNLDFIKSNRSMRAYIKRPLCNQIFQIKPRLEVIDFFSRLKCFESKDPQSYLARFNALFGNRLIARVNVDRVFSFLLSLKLDSKIIVGVSSVEHLVHLSNLTSEFPDWDEFEIVKHIENWSKKANQGSWETLT